MQEILRQILEAIYELTFSQYSHGFRPGKSCQTALDQTKLCRGSSWVIEGDITGFFDNIDHEILIEILKRKIKDGRIIELIFIYGLFFNIIIFKSNAEEVEVTENTEI